MIASIAQPILPALLLGAFPPNDGPASDMPPVFAEMLARLDFAPEPGPQAIMDAPVAADAPETQVAIETDLGPVPDGLEDIAETLAAALAAVYAAAGKPIAPRFGRQTVETAAPASPRPVRVAAMASAALPVPAAAILAPITASPLPAATIDPAIVKASPDATIVPAAAPAPVATPPARTAKIVPPTALAATARSEPTATMPAPEATVAPDPAPSPKRARSFRAAAEPIPTPPAATATVKPTVTPATAPATVAPAPIPAKRAPAAPQPNPETAMTPQATPAVAPAAIAELVAAPATTPSTDAAIAVARLAVEPPAPAAMKIQAKPDAIETVGADLPPAAPDAAVVDQAEPAPTTPSAHAPLIARAETAAATPEPAAPIPTMTPPAAPEAARTPTIATVLTDASVQPQSTSEILIGHHLDLARDGEWLDRLARDIARTANHDAQLRFQLNPEHLGSLRVELANTADGTAIRLTADSEAARAILVDAQPRLIAEARAQGLRISETQVDLGGQTGQQRGKEENPQTFVRTQRQREDSPAQSPGSAAERYA